MSRHLAQVGRIYAVHIHVTGDEEYIFGYTGDQWQFRLDARLEHCVVIIRAMKGAARVVDHNGSVRSACVQARVGQEDTCKGEAPRNGVGADKPQHHKVERWTDSGYRKSASRSSAAA